MEITPMVKDKVLDIICKECRLEALEKLNTAVMLEMSNLSYDELHAVLKQFERYNFISELVMHRVEFKLVLQLEALDFRKNGGFKSHDDLLKLNIEKLLLEIESLKPIFPDRVNTITAIIANITQALSFFFSNKP